MTKNRSTLLWKVLVVFIIATMLLVACAPQAAEEAPAAEEPAAAEEVVEEEAEVAEEAEEPAEAEEAAEFSYEGHIRRGSSFPGLAIRNRCCPGQCHTL